MEWEEIVKKVKEINLKEDEKIREFRKNVFPFYQRLFKEIGLELTEEDKKKREKDVDEMKSSTIIPKNFKNFDEVVFPSTSREREKRLTLDYCVIRNKTHDLFKDENYATGIGIEFAGKCVKEGRIENKINIGLMRVHQTGERKRGGKEYDKYHEWFIKNGYLKQYDLEKKIPDEKEIMEEWKKIIEKVEKDGLDKILKDIKREFQNISKIINALLTKPFLILAGVSGTGKTQIARIIANVMSEEK